MQDVVTVRVVWGKAVRTRLKTRVLYTDTVDVGRRVDVRSSVDDRTIVPEVKVVKVDLTVTDMVDEKTTLRVVDLVEVVPVVELEGETSASTSCAKTSKRSAKENTTTLAMMLRYQEQQNVRMLIALPTIPGTRFKKGLGSWIIKKNSCKSVFLPFSSPYIIRKGERQHCTCFKNKNLK